MSIQKPALKDLDKYTKTFDKEAKSKLLSLVWYLALSGQNLNINHSEKEIFFYLPLSTFYFLDVFCNIIAKIAMATVGLKFEWFYS